MVIHVLMYNADAMIAIVKCLAYLLSMNTPISIVGIYAISPNLLDQLSIMILIDHLLSYSKKI